MVLLPTSGARYFLIWRSMVRIISSLSYPTTRNKSIVMSYNPYRYNPDQYDSTTPTTPGYSTYDLEQDPSTNPPQEQHQHQLQVYIPPTIHLPEPSVPSSNLSQFRLANYAHQPPTIQPAEGLQQSGHLLQQPPPAPHSGLPVRSSATRERARAAAHPYRDRRQSESRGSTVMREPLASGSVRHSVPPIIGSSAITMGCPAQGGRADGGGSSAGTSAATQQPQQPPAGSNVSRFEATKNYMIRADMHYDTDANHLKAMFELPGLKKNDVKIILNKCPYTRVKQIVVSGTSKKVFPDTGHSVRERRFGRFSRVLVVPPDTTADKVVVEMEDGILTITIPGPETTAAPEEPASIAIP